MLPSSTHETNGRTGFASGTGRHRAAKVRRTTRQRLFAGVGLAGIVSLAVPMITANAASAAAPAAVPASAPAAAPAAVAATPTSASTARTTTASYYTVVAGDWLSAIATGHDVNGGWQRLYALNRSVLTQGPDLIFPGERLALSGGTATPAATSADATSADVVSNSANPDGSSSNRSASSSSASDNSSSDSVSSAPAAAATSTTTSTSSSSSTATSTGMAAAVAFAQAQVGDAYVYGATGPNTWDCSGLTQAALAQAGISIPRTSEEQAAAATPVSMNALQPGDLLFWSTDGTAANAYHVAIYIGNGSYVEAANPSAGVKIDTISDYTPSFAGRF